jgi:DNA-binding NtrC family response regulator
LGESKLRGFGGKIIAATNRNLAEEMHAGRFREDLYYRLCSDLIVTASLREQLSDAPQDLRNLLMFTVQRITRDDAGVLAVEIERWIDRNLGRDYAWPGNMRELEQCVRNYLVRGEYHPAQVNHRQADGAKAWLTAAERGTLSADEMLSHYCKWVYAQVGTYEAVATRLGLDRRTVKKRVTENSNASDSE